ncbi:MAG: hypothetical protein KF678_08890 [Phycisphaeraceae bacterium]|nr:hypothetical protein [Phycisphaeraceae bacterium]
MRPATLASFAAFGLALPASAAIVGVTGMTTWLGVPPPNCTPTALTGQFAFCWDEQQNVLLNQPVDMVNNPGSSNAAVPGFVNGVYDSHFLHFDNQMGTPPATGTITFNNPIVAVIYGNNLLDLSDPTAGAFGTVYPTGFPFRGLFTAPSSFVTVLGNTLSFDLNTFHPVYVIDQVRVLTAVPAPGSFALLTIAGGLVMRLRRS